MSKIYHITHLPRLESIKKFFGEGGFIGFSCQQRSADMTSSVESFPVIAPLARNLKGSLNVQNGECKVSGLIKEVIDPDHFLQAGMKFSAKFNIWGREDINKKEDIIDDINVERLEYRDNCYVMHYNIKIYGIASISGSPDPSQSVLLPS